MISYPVSAFEWYREQVYTTKQQKLPHFKAVPTEKDETDSIRLKPKSVTIRVIKNGSRQVNYRNPNNVQL